MKILEDLHHLTGHRKHVFVGRDPGKAMSDGAINAALLSVVTRFDAPMIT